MYTFKSTSLEWQTKTGKVYRNILKIENKSACIIYVWNAN